MRRNSLALTGAALAVLLMLPSGTMASATTTKACPKGHKTMMVHGKLVKCAPLKGKPRAKPKAKPKPSASPTSSVPPLGTLLVISGFTFSHISVKSGSTVTVHNGDAADHTLTIAAANIDVDVTGGGTATFTAPKTPGTYALTCDFHPSMKGTLVVVA